MSTGLALLTALAYLPPLALIAWLLSEYSRYPRWLLIGALSILPLFYVGHYLLIDALQGWPSRGDVPEQFDLLAYEVTEPDITHGDAGEILLWLRGNEEKRPRVHSLPYSKALHQKLVAAEERQAEGHAQQGHRTTSSPSQDVAKADNQDVITFEDAPKTILPQKPTTL